MVTVNLLEELIDTYLENFDEINYVLDRNSLGYSGKDQGYVQNHTGDC
nr:hypothetical protein BN993_06265 [Virgibacillus halodenitrificans]